MHIYVCVSVPFISRSNSKALTATRLNIQKVVSLHYIDVFSRII